ncbi:MAG TPA: PQQ-dependent sugar dehydrogenase [Patescibacteria group bacterium]|nr:PQQ-dependent sugar dehydrogenase [Patescibacteria group bacterium]
MQSKYRALRKHSRAKIRRMSRKQIIFIVSFIVIGVAGLVYVRAAPSAPSYASVDICEDTQPEGNAYIGHDHLHTSCGHYVSFGFQPPTNVSTNLTPVANGASAPDDIQFTGTAGDKRLFIVSQRGKIHVSNADNANVSGAVFLDVGSKITTGNAEQGLLGLAFDPNYATNGYFYISYTANSDRGTFNGQNIHNGDVVVSRFTRSSGNANVADPNSEMVVIAYNKPEPNHNGGGLVFGKDGYLYISVGDGGGAGDHHTNNCSYGNAQCLNSYLGKILRIDIKGATTAQRYKIPAGNPFANTANAKPEIWHYGLRNPWRFSFDRQTGDMFIGDVGQDQREEVDFVVAGVSARNFGWPCYEGTAVYNASSGSSCQPNVMPIFDYKHTDSDTSKPTGCSVIGGYIYRGDTQPEFDGTYIFSDFCHSDLWYLTRTINGSWQLHQTKPTGLSAITAFGQDTAGEIYLASQEGTVYRIDVSH